MEFRRPFNWAKYQRKRIKEDAMPSDHKSLFEQLMNSRSTEHTGGKKKIMINIPSDIYEQHLTNWLRGRMNEPFESEEEGEMCSILYRLSKAQMRECDRGEAFPFIGDFKIKAEDVDKLLPYAKSQNIQIRAYINDICHRNQNYPQKFDMAKLASADYMSLYSRLHHPWFLLRAVTVRSYKKIHEIGFIEDVCQAVSKVIYPFWMKDICVSLRKSYTAEELHPLAHIITGKIESFNDTHRGGERAYMDSLKELGALTTADMHYQKAISYEKEYDNNIATKEPNTIYPNNVDIIQHAYDEIYLVRRAHPADEKRLKDKLISEQKDLNENLIRYGPRIPYSLSEEHMGSINDWVNAVDIQSPNDVLMFMKTIPFPTKSQIDKSCLISARRNPMTALLGGKRIGDQGQTLGKTEPEQFQRIDVYMYARLSYRYLIASVLGKSINEWDQINEDEFGQAICDCCKSSIIEKDRIPIWARGIVNGLKGDFIVAVHLLIPQIERYLVCKAESLNGDLLAFGNPDHQDEAGLSKALNLLKPYFKEDLFNDFWYFLNDASDVNLRNRVAHGLITIDEITTQAPYCLWIAVKLFLCEDEIFSK